MYIIFFLVSSVFASGWETRSLKESTYSRDNTFCQMGNKRIQIEIRSAASQTESGEKKYGDTLFYYREDNQKSEPKLLPLNQEKLNTYRFFEGKSTLCSKSQGYAVGPDKLAVLFLKENRHFSSLIPNLRNQKTPLIRNSWWIKHSLQRMVFSFAPTPIDLGLSQEKRKSKTLTTLFKTAIFLSG